MGSYGIAFSAEDRLSLGTRVEIVGSSFVNSGNHTMEVEWRNAGMSESCGKWRNRLLAGYGQTERGFYALADSNDGAGS